MLALHVKQSLHHCPAICSLSCAADGKLVSGITLVSAFEKLLELGAEVIGVNCVNGPDATLELCRQIPGVQSAYPNAGLPEKRADGGFGYRTTPEEFAGAAVALTQCGARLIGGCCGIGPAHIKAMTLAFENAGL